MKRIIVRKDSYYDSVFLMLISTEVKKQPGVTEAVVAMGTEMNKELLSDMGLSDDAVASATANDLIIALEASDDAAARAAEEAAMEALKKKASADDGVRFKPGSLQAALQVAPEANVAVISVPGRYAAREARKALQSGLHVMMFSDNVSIEEEVTLKTLARERGLLMMGPDCGTAIINGHPLCFANVIPRGEIGIVSASGTGLQEVSCSIAKAGGGVSQAIGTGGRDLKNAQVGGTTALMAIEALKLDPATKVVVVISKPPLPELAAKVDEALKTAGKPCVVHLIGQPQKPNAGSVHYAGNLEETAKLAVALAQGKSYAPRLFDADDARIAALVEAETRGMSKGQRYVRGMFTGGTLTDEAAVLLGPALGGVYSFDAVDPAFKLRDPHVSQQHTIVDLGEDFFTVGRPHPMIDPSIRTERITREAADAEVAVMLVDCVLGYGSHMDPAGAMVDSLKAAKEAAAKRGGYLSIVASVTGTAGDPQNEAEQRRKLESIGVVVMPSNFQAAMLVKKIMERRAAQ